MNKTAIAITLIVVIGALAALAMFLFRNQGLQQNPPPLKISELQTAKAAGTLSFKNGQFVIRVNEIKQVYLLNSGNPKVVIALKPLLNLQVEITGKPNGSAERSGDWYLLSVNGKQILQDSQLQEEFNFSSFYSKLSGNKKDCVDQVLGQTEVQALVNNPAGILDLSNDKLQKAAACIE